MRLHSIVRKLTRLDTICAVLIVGVCTWGASQVFAALQKRDRQGEMSLNTFAVGPASFFLRHGSTCVGTLHTSLIFKDGLPVLTGSAELRYRLGESPEKITAQFEGYFNSLRLLGASILTIESTRSAITFGTQNINPLKLRFGGKLEGRPFSYELEVPGPVELRESRANIYRLSYPHAENLPRLYQQIAGHHPLLTDQPFALVPSSIVDRACAEDTSSAIELAPYLEMFKRFEKLSEPVVPAP